MPDGSFKGMAPDPDSVRSGRERWVRGETRGEFQLCERCNGLLFEGDWPWCKGNPKDHER
jgi:hypothetical protein